MAEEIFLQNWVFTKFAWPFLLIFFITYAILEKTKLLGESKQINALVGFVIGLIFVGAIYPKLVVGNLILFLTVAIIVVFVGLLLWGFVTGSKEIKIEGKGMKIVFGILVFIAMIAAVLWATGTGGTIYDFLFNRTWSGSFWTNIIFVIVIAVALALALGRKKA